MKYETRRIGTRVEISCTEWYGWLTAREIAKRYGLRTDAVRKRVRTGKAMSDPLRIDRRSPEYVPPVPREIARQASAANPFAVLKWHQYPAVAA
jgi:hypothetical protein